mmetsp:Transcript_10304/g.18745  ORF Transcript_10304/g.18745 Transcript_10304/m.18745 type:complete len:485 (-) Transcript_10304:47-1501(-)
MKVSTTALLLLCASTRSATAFAPVTKNRHSSVLKAQSPLDKISVEGGHVFTKEDQPGTPTLKGNTSRRPKWLVSSSSVKAPPKPPSPVMIEAKQNAEERLQGIERNSQMAIEVKNRVAMIRERNAARLDRSSKKILVENDEEKRVEIPTAKKTTAATTNVAPVENAVAEGTTTRTTMQVKQNAETATPIKAAPKQKRWLPQQALRADPREPIGWWGPERPVKGTYQLPRPVLPDVQAANFRPKTRITTRVGETPKEPLVATPKKIMPQAKPLATPKTPEPVAAPNKIVPQAQAVAMPKAAISDETAHKDSTFDKSKSPVETKSIKTVEPKPSKSGFAKTETPVSEKSLPKAPVKAVEAKPVSGSGFFDKKVALKSNVKAAEEPKRSTSGFAKTETPVPEKSALPKAVKAVEAKPISGSGFFNKKVSIKSNVQAAEAQKKATPKATSPNGFATITVTKGVKPASKTAMSMAADPYSSMDWPHDQS